MPWAGFAESTKDVTVKTAALPAIWSEPAKFKEAQEKFQSAVSRLVAATKTGDEASVKAAIDRKSTRLNSSHQIISYAVFCLKKKKNKNSRRTQTKGVSLHTVCS